MVWQALAGIAGGLAQAFDQSGPEVQKLRYKNKNKSVRKVRETTTSTGDLNRLVAASEAAGFNPLTVLRAGGLSFFNTVEHKLKDRVKTKDKGWQEQVVQQGPGTASNIFSGLSTMATGLSNQQAFNMAQANQAAQHELIQAQVSNLLGSPTGGFAGGGFGGGSPSLGGSTTIPTPGSFTAAPGFTPGESTQTPMWPTSTWYERNPWTPDAEVFETVLGDNIAASILATAVTGPAEVLWNVAFRPKHNYIDKYSEFLRKNVTPHIRTAIQNGQQVLATPEFTPNPLDLMGPVLSHPGKTGYGPYGSPQTENQ